MGRRGPQPQPSAIKKLHGNPGKRPLNEREPEPRPTTPDPPEHLGAVAVAKWRQLVPMLSRLRVLTEADELALALLCETWQHYCEAVADRKKYCVAMVRKVRDDHGDYIHVRRNPFATEEHKHKAELIQLMREFGLTPSSRTALTVDDTAANPLAKYGIVG